MGGGGAVGGEAEREREERAEQHTPFFSHQHSFCLSSSLALYIKPHALIHRRALRALRPSSIDQDHNPLLFPQRAESFPPEKIGCVPLSRAPTPSSQTRPLCSALDPPERRRIALKSPGTQGTPATHPPHRSRGRAPPPLRERERGRLLCCGSPPPHSSPLYRHFFARPAPVKPPPGPPPPTRETVLACVARPIAIGRRRLGARVAAGGLRAQRLCP